MTTRTILIIWIRGAGCLPDGAVLQSWGGSDTPADSGLGESWFFGAMDPYTDFIGLMPPVRRLDRSSATVSASTPGLTAPRSSSA